MMAVVHHRSIMTRLVIKFPVLVPKFQQMNPESGTERHARK